MEIAVAVAVVIVITSCAFILAKVLGRRRLAKEREEGRLRRVNSARHYVDRT